MINKKTFAMTMTAIAGVGFTAYLAARETPKATAVLEKKKLEASKDLTGWEKLTTIVWSYKGTIGAGIATASLIFGTYLLNARETASLTAAYALGEQLYKNYGNEVKKRFGLETHNDIVDTIHKESCDPPILYACGACETFTTSWGDDEDDETCLFYDDYSNRYFESTKANVIAAELHLNRNLSIDGFASANMWSDFLGLKRRDEDTGVGWDCDWIYDERGVVTLDFHHYITEDDSGLAVHHIAMIVEPHECDSGAEYSPEESVAG